MSPFGEVTHIWKITAIIRPDRRAMAHLLSSRFSCAKKTPTPFMKRLRFPCTLLDGCVNTDTSSTAW